MPPKGRDQTLETYIKAIRSDTLSHTNNTQHHRVSDNLRREERQALKALRSRSDIIIKPADKGSAVVVQSNEDYLVEAYRQLNDTSSYQKLPGDLTTTHSQELKRIVMELFNKGVIDKHTKNFLIPRQPRPARFYMLPKIHKVGNPGRPIVSSNGAPTENISAFVDYHLRPLVTKLPSYIQDTSDFLRKLQDLPAPPDNTLLVTLDESSLHTNIPHAEGIDTCKEALDTTILSPVTSAS